MTFIITIWNIFLKKFILIKNGSCGCQPLLREERLEAAAPDNITLNFKLTINDFRLLRS